MIVITEHLKLYGSKVTLLIGSREEEREYLNKRYKLKDDEYDPNFVGTTYQLLDSSGRKLGIFVWMPSFNWLISDYTTLCHECVHVAYKIAQNANLPYSTENNENIAYLCDYFFSCFLRKLFKIKNKK